MCCVDELAASGGYMMACCADRILQLGYNVHNSRPCEPEAKADTLARCSPFAAVGSIGVLFGRSVTRTCLSSFCATLDPGFLGCQT